MTISELVEEQANRDTDGETDQAEDADGAS